MEKIEEDWVIVLWKNHQYLERHKDDLIKPNDFEVTKRQYDDGLKRFGKLIETPIAKAINKLD